MHEIGHFFGRRVFWADYHNIQFDNLPDKNWLCLAIANQPPVVAKFSKFARVVIDRHLLEFKGAGRYGEKLHHLFDETMVDLELEERRPFIDIGTTGSSDESLDDTFWQCFFATTLPVTTDYDDLKIICIDLDSVDRRDELLNYIKKFELGWCPGD